MTGQNGCWNVVVCYKKNKVDNLQDDLFAFKINYNDAITATKLYNGNISETFWKTSTDNVLRKYDYKYDDLNRLLQADYSKQGNTTFNSYLEHLWYDKNGNIKTLKRNGGMDTDGFQLVNPIDNLTYLYDTDNQNQLLRVFDETANPQGFKDDNNGTSLITEKAQAPDYGYDANGNMIRDDNKGIQSIIYNHLNLPTKITFANPNNITYLYNAVGQKVNKTVQQSADFIIDKTDYLSGFQYFNEILRFFPHAEGYVNATKNKFDYDFDYVFNYTDHLGNIRLSYSKDINTNALKVIEENHYYPFGLKHTGYNSDVMLYVLEVAPFLKGQPELFARKLKPKQSVDLPANNYKYNGKEYQDELGLNFYDYGARNYDAALGRWMNIDPLAEQTPNWSPYVFCNNNPLYYNDPTGMSASPLYDENGNFLGTDSEGFKGEVRFTTAAIYNSIVNDKNSYYTTNGVIDHDKVKFISDSLNLVIGPNPSSTFTEGEISMVNNAISDVVSKTNGMQFEMSDLHNGKTSSYFAVADGSTTNGFDFIIQSTNDANPYEFTKPDVPANMGGNIMTFNLTSQLWSGGEFTVNNIQNAAVHEGNGHFVKGITGEGKGHAKAFQMQFNHSSWQGTTPAWKKEMRNSFNLINQGKL